jgi:hypothetical protein
VLRYCLKKKLASDEENFKFNNSIVKPNDEPEEVEGSRTISENIPRPSFDLFEWSSSAL